MEVEQAERAVAARTYRRISAQLAIEAGVLRAQSESFADAAKRIEDGDADVDTLRLVAEREASEEASPEELWGERRERILRAVVAASRRPAHELEEAGLERITEEAGEDAQDADDVKAMLDGLIREGFVESHRLAGPGPRPMVVFVPTREGFEEAGHAPPPRGLPDKPESRSVYDVVEQPTREMAAVSRDEAAEAGDR